MKLTSVILIAVAALASVSAAATQTQAAAAAAAQQRAFVSYVGAFNKQYATKDVFKRLAAFTDNVAFIEAHNSKRGVTYELGLNAFTDLTFAEFTAKFAGRTTPVDARAARGPAGDNDFADEYQAQQLREQGVPEKVDWRDFGAVNPISQQGDCDNSYAFAATAAAEASAALGGRPLPKLSESQLVDCTSKFDGCYGCFGGSGAGALEWAAKNGGFCSAADYPNTEKQADCRPCKGVVQAKKVVRTEPNDEHEMIKAAAYSVVVTTVYASRSFQMYKRGVFSGEDCETRGPNAAVAVVGFSFVNVHTETPYLILRNSYGTTWGEKGYMKYRMFKNRCYIANRPAYVEY